MKIKKAIVTALILLLLCNISIANIRHKNIYIYDDDGVNQISLMYIIHMMDHITGNNYKIKKITAEQIMSGEWVNNAALFIMPEGRNAEYNRKLAGNGNKIINKYVKNGGSYLGICSGAYYVTKYVEYQNDNEGQPITGHGMRFFDGAAIGSIPDKNNKKYKKFDKSIEPMLKIQFKKGVISMLDNNNAYFKTKKNQNVSIISNYLANKMPAIIYIKYNKGNVVLSGLHLEYLTQENYLLYIKMKSNKLFDALIRNIMSKLNIKTVQTNYEH